ncbi:MAG: alkaline phosphatase family protein [Planctomycetaceae bacterium]|nr:alkaline phosphatase family protein [Planctomycetaceae bacterium]
MTTRFLTVCILFMAFSVCSAAFGQSAAKQAGRITHNVVLVTVDGLRWQEVFGGSEEALLDKDAGGVKDLDATRNRFHRETAEERRQTLMPFFWNVIAKEGVVFGNPEHDSKAVVTNGLNFSYPGYSEILCGYADSSIDSNAKKDNKNVTVLEWVQSKPGFEKSVAAFCSWDVFPFIINETRSRIPVNAGWEPLGTDSSLGLMGTPAGERLLKLDEVSREFPRYFPEVRYDYVTFRAAEEYVQARKPRLLYLSLGETDDWAHAGRYDLYLDAASRTDDYIRRLWETLQSMPEYKGRTTLILTTDHGRGDNRVDWKSHGEKIEGSEFIWMAVMGPDAAPQLITDSTVTQSQIAATVAASLGLDYNSEVPKAASPLPVVK